MWLSPENRRLVVQMVVVVSLSLAGSAGLASGAPAPPDHAEQNDRVSKALRELDRLEKYVQLLEIRDGVVDKKLQRDRAIPDIVRVDSRSTLVVTADLAEESIITLRAGDIEDVCIRVGTDTKPDLGVISLHVARPQPRLVRLPPAAAAFDVLLTVLPQTCASRPDWTNALPRVLRIASVNSAVLDLLGSSEQYAIRELRHGRTTAGEDLLTAARKASRRVQIDKSSRLVIEAKIGDTAVVEALHKAGLTGLCIEATWTVGSASYSDRMAVTAPAAGPTEASKSVEIAAAQSYSLTITTSDRTCGEAGATRLSQRVYAVDLARYGWTPVLTDAFMLYGETRLPNTDFPSRVLRRRQTLKPGLNVFFWDDLREETPWWSKYPRRMIGVNATPGITVAGPNVAGIGGGQEAVSVGLVLADPWSRSVFVGAGWLIYTDATDSLHRPGFFFVGASGGQLAEVLAKKLLKK